jgi:hypothetical protein
VPQRAEESTGRTMRVSGVGTSVPRGAPPPAWSQPGTKPSARRSAEERERRHRERTIAAWLRSLNR